MHYSIEILDVKNGIALKNIYCISTTDLQILQDEELLKFIDMECFFWSTVPADMTPLINAGMVFCDRHFGGINYPIGGVGQIAQQLAEGFVECGGELRYKANVVKIVTEGEGDEVRAVGVQLLDGEVLRQGGGHSVHFESNLSFPIPKVNEEKSCDQGLDLL